MAYLLHVSGVCIYCLLLLYRTVQCAFHHSVKVKSPAEHSSLAFLEFPNQDRPNAAQLSSPGAACFGQSIGRCSTRVVWLWRTRWYLWLEAESTTYSQTQYLKLHRHAGHGWETGRGKRVALFRYCLHHQGTDRRLSSPCTQENQQ